MADEHDDTTEERLETHKEQLSALFTRLVASSLVDNFLNRGLGRSPWRSAYPDAYQAIFDYRSQLVEQVAADLSAFTTSERNKPVMTVKRVVATGYTVTRDDGLVTDDQGKKIE